MKKTIIALVPMTLFFTLLFSQEGSSWKMAGTKISTPWAASVKPESVHQEYPRPQLVRGNWMNLNGLWNYTILPSSSETIPAAYAGKILVPFAVESALSGVGSRVGKDSLLWYQRELVIPSAMRKNRLMLHFGAVCFALA